MLYKTRQQKQRHLLTASNRLPNLRSRQFLLNLFRRTRLSRTSPFLRAAMGIVRWSIIKAYDGKDLIAHRASCIISGRARGTSQRFSISRTKVKEISSDGKLFGVRKSSW